MAKKLNEPVKILIPVKNIWKLRNSLLILKLLVKFIFFIWIYVLPKVVPFKNRGQSDRLYSDVISFTCLFCTKIITFCFRVWWMFVCCLRYSFIIFVDHNIFSSLTPETNIKINSSKKSSIKFLINQRIKNKVDVCSMLCIWLYKRTKFSKTA